MNWLQDLNNKELIDYFEEAVSKCDYVDDFKKEILFRMKGNEDKWYNKGYNVRAADMESTS